MTAKGIVIKVAGPVVEAKGLSDSVMHEMVEVGHDGLIGEIIRLEGEYATIQVYQNTTGLKLNEPVLGTGSPLSVELAPGLLGNTFDGIQRPLETIRQITGPFIKQARGVTALSEKRSGLLHLKPKLATNSQPVIFSVLSKKPTWSSIVY